MEQTLEMIIGSDPAQQEAWFLGQMGQPETRTDLLIDFLLKTAERGQKERSEIWAEMLQESLLEKKDRKAGLKLLAARSFWQSTGTEIRAKWTDLAGRILGSSREDRILVDNAGFSKNVDTVECIRRLQVLLQLKPGLLCHDKTWGFGIIQNVDLFYAKVEINFDKKSRHLMSLAYAAESLEVISDDHLLARKHRNPEELKALVTNDPAEVVRITLRSFGPLSAPLLQERLVPAIFPESDWKRFWDGARKALKNDPLVEIPARRSDPIRLLAREKKLDHHWFKILAGERDMATVLRRAEEVLESPEVLAALGPTEKGVLGERLAFVIKGAGRRHAGLTARALMLAAQLGVDPQVIDVRAHAAIYWRDDIILAVLKDLPARLVRPFMDFLLSMDEEGTLQRLLDILPRLELSALSEALSLLRSKGRDEVCASVFRKAVGVQRAEVEYLCWLSKNADLIETWDLGPVPQISELMLIELEKDYSGERLKAQNQLRERFEMKEWLKMTLSALSEAKRREFLLKVRDSEAWPTVDRQSVMGKMIKLYPELQEVLSAKLKNADGGIASRGPVTSIRSYRERQQQLEKIITVEIPRIAREIGVARSYGDLRENFEYKAAKETQGILLSRRAELEKILHEVRPADFKGLPFDKAGMATGVVLEYADGHIESYYILGEWDQDDDRKIISTASRMAKALDGHAAGESVVIPTERGEESCLLKEVTPLPPEIQ
ncbi:MAG: GreA/GreB family elongation factor, partial [Lentisphaerota bacterium]